jgi:transketolase
MMEQVARKTKARLLRMHYECNVGHIGGNLSCIDILLTLMHRCMGPDDELVLSKGHAAGALYASLWSTGILTDDDLATYYKDGTQLSAHPPPQAFPAIKFATGSLGHGFSLANGLALAKSFGKKPGRIYCVTSDGEWQEGSTWEALIFAAHRNLSITVIVDQNGLQGFGTTAEVAGMHELTDKIRAFGAPVAEIDGHDHGAIEAACATTEPGLRVFVAKTRKGKGVSYMQDKMEWHYLPMSAEMYKTALEDLGLDGDAA